MVLDMVGGDYVARNLSLLNRYGRHISIAFLNNRIADIDLAAMMTKQITMTGSTLRPQSHETKAGIARQLEQHIWPKLADKTIKPGLKKTFSFDRVQESHRWLESDETMGKGVLMMLET